MEETRRPKRDRTRTALIDAAAQVIGERGLDRTSLEDVAIRAGMTRGAIYGNFRNKEELFLAVASTHWRPVLPPPMSPHATLADRMHAYGHAVADAADSRREHAAGAVSFVLYALTHDEIRTLLQRANQSIYASSAEQLRASFASTELPILPERFVRLVHALTEGLVTLHALTPDLITREIIVDAFLALANTSAEKHTRK